MSNHFKAQIIERRKGHPDEGKVVFETPTAPNLILQNGMNRFATNGIATNFTHCAIGSDATPVEDDSGAVTATTTGTACNSDGAFFVVGDVGKLLRFDTGEKSIIAAYVDGDTVTLSDTLNVSSGTLFTMYRIAQTGLFAEVKRSSTYLTGSGNCGTTLSGSLFTHQRTFDFPVETGDVTYSEVGFGASATVAQNLYMRGIFSGAPVSVLTGQQIRVIYYFLLTVSPTSPRDGEVAVSGWPSLEHPVAMDETTDKVTLVTHGFAAGTQIFFDGAVCPTGLTFNTNYFVITVDGDHFKLAETYADAIAGTPVIDFTSNGTSVILFTNTKGTEQMMGPYVTSVLSATGGNTSYITGANSAVLQTLEPSGGKAMRLSVTSTVHGTWPTAVAITLLADAALTAEAYVQDSHEKFYGGSFAVGAGNSAVLRSIQVTSTDGSGPGLRYLFDHNQEKTSLYTLAFRFKFTWDWDFS
jgi:hypothetical protein